MFKTMDDKKVINELVSELKLLVLEVLKDKKVKKFVEVENYLNETLEGCSFQTGGWSVEFAYVNNGKIYYDISRLMDVSSFKIPKTL